MANKNLILSVIIAECDYDAYKIYHPLHEISAVTVMHVTSFSSLYAVPHFNILIPLATALH